MTELKVLELFSGIGGMHFALKESHVAGSVVAAIEINPVANSVYHHNYPEVNLKNNNIQSLTKKFVQKTGANTILMSPPCQPFTRNGNYGDVEDNRTDAFKHICEMIRLDQLPDIEYILMENVKGFENSRAKELYIDALQDAEFYFEEFLLSPSQLGIPNSRTRYYCLARKFHPFSFTSEDIHCDFPRKSKDLKTSKIREFVYPTEEQDYLLPEKVLESRFNVLDICTGESTNSMCFTKAYSRYLEGTGSVYSNHSKVDLENTLKKIQGSKNTEEIVSLKKSLELRFFSPSEVAKLMCFPNDFGFPKNITDKQKYRLLGNSINVKVVGELIKLMVES